MKITFVAVGSVKKSSIGEASADYLKRIKRYAPVDIVEVKDEGASLKMPREDVLRKEGQRIISALGQGGYTVVLADTGTSMTSAAFSKFIEGLMNQGRKNVSFVVGGAYGLHKDVYDTADLVLSLSAMTLPHDLARLFLYEQVYRAFTIMRGEPYSH
ncbi:MAG: 23S rRNA (pseudouridine(1915)-N(3))-methyltransferase RlmH [Deltaproteobacteria bacterium]|nr:23S rRNA (pseudouridine(1915)-N(3))-methyltransferase RlmH [Deltaproteobacteria bacterium]